MSKLICAGVFGVLTASITLSVGLMRVLQTTVETYVLGTVAFSDNAVSITLLGFVTFAVVKTVNVEFLITALADIDPSSLML